MDEPVRVTSQVLIVTGSSRGIGAATVRLATRRGYSVCVNYLHGDREASGVVSAIEQEGGRAIAVKADVSSEADVMRLFETVDLQLGPVTALVNNAATLEPQNAGGRDGCGTVAAYIRNQRYRILSVRAGGSETNVGSTWWFRRIHR